MDWDLELRNQELESMIIVYQEHIDQLEEENKELKEKVEFLSMMLEYESMGPPIDADINNTTWWYIMTITNIEYNQFIGIYDTEYDTDDLIEYWRYQDKCGATFKRVGTWGASGKKAQGVHARKDSCLATSDFMMDHACGYVYMQFYNLSLIHISEPTRPY